MEWFVTVVYALWICTTPTANTNTTNSNSSTANLTDNPNSIQNPNASTEIDENMFMHFDKCRNSNRGCEMMSYSCMDCSLSRKFADCSYGDVTATNCTVKNETLCRTPEWVHICTPNRNCKRNDWKRMYKANCTVKDDFICLGSRTFYKNVECAWASGYRWDISMILSVFFGGFGVDRFYLGHYKEGLGKLFSFGGVGIWTLLDVILIYTGVVGPEDGSVYLT